MFDGISKWGHICGIGWSYEEADVVCRYMGFSSAVRAFTVRLENAEYFINLVNCGIGMYTSLQMCTFTSWNNNFRYCIQHHAAGIECSGKG